MKRFLQSFFSGDSKSPASSNEMFIWPDGAPGSEGKSGEEKAKISGGERILSNIHRPSVIPYIPSPVIALRTAVIIAPGGGHSELWADHEGHNPASFLCQRGIASFVLKYRLSDEVNSSYTIHDHSLADIQQAIRLVRSLAREWKINSSRIGVMGFSAGGELAALSAMRFDHGDKNASDGISQQSSFPNFHALIYPDGIDHIEVSKNSSPAFLLCGVADTAFSKALANIFLRYKEAGIPAEMHIYANEGHGFGVRKTNNALIARWPECFMEWLSSSGFL